jgi:ABC-type multidrug transport system, ATPase component
VGNILEIENLTKKYPDFTLDALSFSIPQGTIMGLIGENGAGKTTTINLVLNELNKDGGGIKIFGKDHLEHERAVKEKIGVVFDDCHFPDLFNADEMELFMKNIYATWQTKTYRDYLKRFGLPRDKPIKAYSKGMKVKLSFAVALSHQPQLLLLDEATSGLDPVMRDEILDLLLEFVQDENHGVLFSSHITDDLEKVADYITFIHKGKLLFSKTKDELIYQYGVIKCGAEMFNQMDKADMIAYRKQDYEWQVLVADQEEARRKYKKCLIDSVTISEIMLFHVKGEKK